MRPGYYDMFQIINVCEYLIYCNFSTTRIDSRLGFFQKNFDLTGEEVRCLAETDPKLITYNMHSIQTNNFSIKLEMGFKKEEVKCLLLTAPKIWKMSELFSI